MASQLQNKHITPEGDIFCGNQRDERFNGFQVCDWSVAANPMFLLVKTGAQISLTRTVSIELRGAISHKIEGDRQYIQPANLHSYLVKYKLFLEVFFYK